MSDSRPATTLTIRAALLAGALLVCSAGLAAASTITCGYGGSTNSDQSCAGGGNSNFYFFGPYQVFLAFDTVSGPFDVAIADVLTSQTALTQAQRLDNFPGYTCVTLDGVNCVEFEVTAPAPGPNTWTGFYDLSIFWAFDTNSMFPNDPGDLIRILHNRGDTPGNGFDTDITVIGSYVGEAQPNDPGIGGRDDNFQSFLVVQAPATVPEPGSMLLLGSGLGAWLLRRRR